MGIRRVVTGHDEHGKAVFASDEVVEPVTVDLLPGNEFFQMWGADETSRFPDDGSKPSFTTYFPPLGGFRFGLFTIPPGQDATLDGVDVEAALAEMESRLPGMAAHFEPEAPGMHTTASIDYEFVVSGEVVLELDDGAERTLRAGDTVVQNGTRHAWRNRTDQPATLVVVLIGAHRD